MNSKDKKEAQGWLESLWNSCQEGYDGTWDTVSGRDGFKDMQFGIETVARLTGITLEDLVEPADEESEDMK